MDRSQIDYTTIVELLLRSGASADVPLLFPTGIVALDELLREYGVQN